MYTVVFMLLAILATFIEYPVYALLHQPVLRSISFLSLILSIFSAWLCALVAINLLKQRIEIEPSRKFKIWAVAANIILNVLLVFTNLSFYTTLLSLYSHVGVAITIEVAILITVVEGAYFWWITDLVLKNQPGWAVLRMKKLWLWINAVFSSRLTRFG